MSERPICSICLEFLTPNCDLKAPHCGHVFHLDCIVLSFRYKPECPICRKSSRGLVHVHLDYNHVPKMVESSESTTNTPSPTPTEDTADEKEQIKILKMKLKAETRKVELANKRIRDLEKKLREKDEHLSHCTSQRTSQLQDEDEERPHCSTQRPRPLRAGSNNHYPSDQNSAHCSTQRAKQQDADGERPHCSSQGVRQLQVGSEDRPHCSRQPQSEYEDRLHCSSQRAGQLKNQAEEERPQCSSHQRLWELQAMNDDRPTTSTQRGLAGNSNHAHHLAQRERQLRYEDDDDDDDLPFEFTYIGSSTPAYMMTHRYRSREAPTSENNGGANHADDNSDSPTDELSDEFMLRP